MPFIKAKNGNVIELAEDLVKEFLAQGHAGPFETEAEAGKWTQEPPAGTPLTDEELARVAAIESGTPASETPAGPNEPKGNGSREEWAAWADHLGVEYEAEAKRDDIKAAVAAALDEE